MKPKFKNLFLFLFVSLLLITPIHKSYVFANTFTPAKLFSTSSSDEKNEASDESEDSNVFDFIKDKKSVEDFFYDGSALLYGGILLIGISVLGIFKTLRPKKKKRNNQSKGRRINNFENRR